ncbi:MAG: hypothetical protein C9356_15295 [Oleiphilus sp.]|nr:MAG: hypothetical protein C9356_15295 [Oleiphilus sp.]
MKKLLLGSLLGLSAVSAAASDQSTFSAELLVGKTTQEIEGDDGDDTSIGIRGAYLPNANVAIEAGYQFNGEASYSYPLSGFGEITESTETRALNLGVKGIIPVNETFGLHARLGLAFWKADVEVSSSLAPSTPATGSDSGNDLYYGIGVHFSPISELLIGLEYTLAEYDVTLDGDLDGVSADIELDTVGLTLGVKF